jgi:predicted metalloprotease with PDZ domain
MRKGVRIDAQRVATTLLATAVVALIATALATWRDSAVQQEQLRQLERRVDGLEKHLAVRAARRNCDAGQFFNCHCVNLLNKIRLEHV